MTNFPFCPPHHTSSNLPPLLTFLLNTAYRLSNLLIELEICPAYPHCTHYSIPTHSTFLSERLCTSTSRLQFIQDNCCTVVIIALSVAAISSVVVARKQIVICTGHTVQLYIVHRAQGIRSIFTSLLQCFVQSNMVGEMKLTLEMVRKSFLVLTA